MSEDNPKKEEAKTEEQAKEEAKQDSKEEAKPVEEPKREEAPKEEKIEEKPKLETEVKLKPKPKPIKKDYKLKTISEKKNTLIKRAEYMIQVSHAAQPTPVRADLMKEIAKFLKVNEDGILVEKIFSERGMAQSNAKVFVYKDKKSIPKHKLDKIEKRMGIKKDAEQKPATPAEKPAEEKKEALKEEAKLAEENPAEQKSEDKKE